jgi:hypothetical protein
LDLEPELDYFKNWTPNQVTGTRTENFEKNKINFNLIGGLTRGQPAVNCQLQAGLPETRSEPVLIFRTKTRIIIIFSGTRTVFYCTTCNSVQLYINS